MPDLIQREEVTLTSMEGVQITYALSKMPSTVAREIVTQYPLSSIPKLGDYPRNEELMLKMMRYVGVAGAGKDNGDLMLTTRALIDNHVPDFETLLKLEMAMLEKNCSFFSKGGLSKFLEVAAGKVQELITSTLTDLLQQSLKKD